MLLKFYSIKTNNWFKGFAPDTSSQIPEDAVAATSSSNTPTHPARASLSSSNSTPQFSLIATTNSSSQSPLAFQVQSPNGLSSSFGTSQSSSLSSSVTQQQQQATNQNHVKASSNTNNQTPKISSQQATPTQSSLQTQNVLFSTSSMSPPNSPKTTIGTSVFDEIVYNLQLDYWTAATNSSNSSELAWVAQPQQLFGHTIVSSSSMSSQKFTQKAWFKSLHVFRTQLVVSSNTSIENNPQSLTLVYQIKEKKQKSKLLTIYFLDLVFYTTRKRDLPHKKGVLP